MWDGPEEILSGIFSGLKKSGWDDMLEKWNSMEGISDMGKPVSLSQGNLNIKVKNSSSLQILNMKKKELLENLRKTMPGEIKNIRFRI